MMILYVIQTNLQPFTDTYIMKLFDRSVDLAIFDEDSPLYPICRAWLKNSPHSRDPPPQSPEPEAPAPTNSEEEVGILCFSFCTCYCYHILYLETIMQKASTLPFVIHMQNR